MDLIYLAHSKVCLALDRQVMVKSPLISWTILPEKSISVHLESISHTREYMLMVFIICSFFHDIILTSGEDETKITHLAGQLSVNIFLTKAFMTFPGHQYSVHGAINITTGRMMSHFPGRTTETCCDLS